MERLWSAHRVLEGLTRSQGLGPLAGPSPRGEAVTLTAAGRHSVNCVATQGWIGRQRLSGVARDCTFAVRRFYCRSADSGPQRAERRKPEAWELGVGRMLVTTSRLQRLARGIFSSWRIGALGADSWR